MTSPHPMACKTPGCVYHITTSGKTLNIKVDLPISFDGIDDDALHEHLHIGAEHLVWALFVMLPHLVWRVHPSELAAIPTHDRIMKRRVA